MSQTMSTSEQRNALVSLVKSPGWGLLRSIATQQIESRSHKILHSVLTGADEAFRQEFEKGEVSGMKLFLMYPDAQIAALNDEKEPQDDE